MKDEQTIPKGKEDINVTCAYIGDKNPEEIVINSFQLFVRKELIE